MNQPPSSFAASLEQALDVLKLPHEAAQSNALTQFASLLVHWNQTYAMISKADIQWEALQDHFVDCLVLVQALLRYEHEREREMPCKTTPHLLDVGSGSGLPGVVLAILMPTWQIHCIDAVGKKSAFIQYAAARLGLASRLKAHHARVEQHRFDTSFDVITSRAFASLARFFQLSQHLLAETGVCVAMKGKPTSDELKEVEPLATFHVEPCQNPLLHKTRCLVWMKKRYNDSPPIVMD